MDYLAQTIRLLAQGFEPPPRMLEQTLSFVNTAYRWLLVQKLRERLEGLQPGEQDYEEIEELLESIGSVEPWVLTEVPPGEVLAATIQWDFQDWEYVDDPEQALQSLPPEVLNEAVTADLSIGGASEGVTWDGNKISIVAPMITDVYSIPALQEWLHQVVNHEIRHVAQHALSWVKGLPEGYAGLPSPRLWEPDRLPEGQPLDPEEREKWDNAWLRVREEQSGEPGTWETLRQEHKLYDVEYWPVLDSYARALMPYLLKKDPKDTRAFLDGVFKGEGPDTDILNPFSVWREKNPGKWRSGVSDLLSIIREIKPEYEEVYG